LRVAALRPVKLLVDNRVDAGIAPVLDSHAGAGGIGEQRAVVCEPLVLELAEVPPSAEFQCSGEPFVFLADVTSELRLADNEGRIADTKIETVAVAKLLVPRSRSSRVAVEHRQWQRHVFDRVDLESDAGRGADRQPRRSANILRKTARIGVGTLRRNTARYMVKQRPGLGFRYTKPREIGPSLKAG
jgi:hypothetical protein